MTAAVDSSLWRTIREAAIHSSIVKSKVGSSGGGDVGTTLETAAAVASVMVEVHERTSYRGTKKTDDGQNVGKKLWLGAENKSFG